jgi:hypothetical protein
MVEDCEEVLLAVSYGVGFWPFSASPANGTTHLFIGASGLYPHGLHFKKRIVQPPPFLFFRLRDVSIPIGDPQTGHGVLYNDFGTKLSD